jgi:hypothetical protein
MTKITDLTAMDGDTIDFDDDVVPIVDVSAVGVARNKKLTVAELLGCPVMTASEALSAGDFVNVHASTGAKIRKADADDDTKPVNGFVPAAIGSGSSGVVILPGRKLSGLSGLTAGGIHYLSTTAGTITDTPPSGSGNLVQEVGVAISATELLFNPRQGFTAP